MGTRTHLAVLCLLYGAVLTAWQPNATSQLGEDFRRFYRPVAIQVLNGDGFRAPEGVADRYPPGYPLLLAPILAIAASTGVSERFMLLALDLGCVYAGAILLHGIAGRLAAGGFAALPAWLWVTYPPVVFSLGHGLTEPPFSVALFGVVMLLLSGQRLRSAALAGLACGAAMLLRPAGIAMLLAAALWLAIFGPPWRPRLARAGVFLAAAVLTIMPWHLYVHGSSGQWIFLSTGGGASILHGLTDLAGLATPARSERVGLIAHRASEAASELRSVRDIAAFLARQDPLGLLEMGALKAGRAWYGTDSHAHEGYLLAMQIPYLGLSVAGAWMIIRRGGSQRQAALLLLLLVVCFWGLTVVVLSILRYMVPVMGLLFVCAYGLWPPSNQVSAGEPAVLPALSAPRSAGAKQ